MHQNTPQNENIFWEGACRSPHPFPRGACPQIQILDLPLDDDDDGGGDDDEHV